MRPPPRLKLLLPCAHLHAPVVTHLRPLPRLHRSRILLGFLLSSLRSALSGPTHRPWPRRHHRRLTTLSRHPAETPPVATPTSSMSSMMNPPKSLTLTLGAAEANRPPDTAAVPPPSCATARTLPGAAGHSPLPFSLPSPPLLLSLSFTFSNLSLSPCHSHK
jgi:hypothetical protein